MAAQLISFLLLGFSARVPLPDVPEDNRDKAWVQGSWRVVAVTHDGKDENVDDYRGMRIVYADGRSHVETEGGGGAFAHMTYRLDPMKKWLDLAEVDEQKEQGRTYLGIYKLDGDRFIFCIGMDGKKRPTELSAKAGSGYRLVTMRRIKD
jgi:uncharacterized protein (TIGR03067 family)